jgi:RHS repeat-associated protein
MQRTLADDLPTDYSYTGQREESALGLMYYVARWYDSGIGHFVQADTVVPGAGNPAAWNRYAYTKYNPVIFVDPSGHGNGYFGDPTDDGNFDGVFYNSPITPASAYGISLQGWSDSDVYRIEYELMMMANNYKKYCNAPACKMLTPQEIFHAVHGSLTLAKTKDLGEGSGCDSGWMTPCGGSAIGCGLGLNLNFEVNGAYLNWGLISHEFGHEFNVSMMSLDISPPYDYVNNDGLLQTTTLYVDDTLILGYDESIDGYRRTSYGYTLRGGAMNRPYVQNKTMIVGEDFADMAMNFHMGWFDDGAYGDARNDFMAMVYSLYLTLYFQE